MFSKNRGLNKFWCVNFYEHPIVDYRKRAVNLFDVSSEGDSGFSSDFMLDGKFDDEQYCLCLMETALAIPEKQLSAFLEYQCAQLNTPYLWLVQFDSLLNNNYNLPLIQPYKNRLNLLTSLIEDQRNKYQTYVKNKERIFNSKTSGRLDLKFKIKEIKKEILIMKNFNDKLFLLLRRRADYLQEVENNEGASFIQAIDIEIAFLSNTANLKNKEPEFKKIVFRGTASQLADIINQLKEKQGKDGELWLDGSISSYARMVATVFCKEDGSSFKETSIRKYLTNYSQDGKSTVKNRVDISSINIME
ncbi:MAG: hypothetical protein AB8F74_07065 [Saprospiraceae bacterium]